MRLAGWPRVGRKEPPGLVHPFGEAGAELLAAADNAIERLRVSRSGQGDNAKPIIRVPYRNIDIHRCARSYVFSTNFELTGLTGGASEHISIFIEGWN